MATRRVSIFLDESLSLEIGGRWSAGDGKRCCIPATGKRIMGKYQIWRSCRRKGNVMVSGIGVKSRERMRAVTQEEYDGVKFYKLAPGITTHPLIRSGKPCIKGTGLKVTDIVALKNFQDMRPADIAKYFEIDLAQVNDALQFYAAHTDYIDTELQLDDLNHQQLVESHYGDFTREILSRRESVAGDP